MAFESSEGVAEVWASLMVEAVAPELEAADSRVGTLLPTLVLVLELGMEEISPTAEAVGTRRLSESGLKLAAAISPTIFSRLMPYTSSLLELFLLVVVALKRADWLFAFAFVDITNFARVL